MTKRLEMRQLTPLEAGVLRCYQNNEPLDSVMSEFGVTKMMVLDIARKLRWALGEDRVPSRVRVSPNNHRTLGKHKEEVLRLNREGWSYTAIARHLGKSVSTVRLRIIQWREELGEDVVPLHPNNHVYTKADMERIAQLLEDKRGKFGYISQEEFDAVGEELGRSGEAVKAKLLRMMKEEEL